MADLKSPTCRDCAKARGYVAVSPMMTMHLGECANCHQAKKISTASDWRRVGKPGNRVLWD